MLFRTRLTLYNILKFVILIAGILSTVTLAGGSTLKPRDFSRHHRAYLGVLWVGAGLAPRLGEEGNGGGCTVLVEF